jgi:aminoglycoside phosphotransferase (APT) family kinase protein
MARATPPDGVIEVVSSVMAAIGSSGPWLIERVPTGRSNVVYRVADRAGRAVAVRVAHGRPSRFPAELSAIQAAGGVGVPVPSVRHVGEVVHRGEALPVMVTNWVDATPLRQAFEVRGTGDPPNALVRSLAQTLAATHSIDVEGFGRLGPELNGSWDRFDHWFVDELEPRAERSRQALVDDPVLGTDRRALALIDEALTEVVAARDLLASSMPRLVHGDVSPDNLLVDLRDGHPDQVSVLLDWESAKGGPPALDFGWWDHIGGAALVPTETLIEAYEAEIGAPVDHVDELRRLVRIRILVAEIGWLTDSQQPPPSLVPAAVALASELRRSGTG